MRQEDYELIITCIHRGVPVIADRLTAVLNSHLELANKYLDEHKDDIEKPEEPKGE